MPHGPASKSTRWVALALILALTAVAAGLGYAKFAKTRPPKWADIEKASSEKRWLQVDSDLALWLEAHPDDANALLMLGMTRIVQGKEADALPLLESIPQTHPGWLQARAVLGELAIKARRAADAERYFRQAANHDPNALNPRQRLIYLLSIQQRSAETRELLWDIYAMTKDPRTLIDLVMELFAAENDVRGVAPEVDDFLAQTPDDPFLCRTRGISWLKSGKAPEALPLLEFASKNLANDPLGRFALAECLMVVGKFDGDLAVLGPTPENPVAAARWWVQRSRLEEALARELDAVQSLRKALEADPNDREAHYRLGLALAKQGDDQGGALHRQQAESIRARQNAVRRRHDQLRRSGVDPSTTLFEELGRLCRDAGLMREARAWFHEAIKLDPLNRSVQQALAQTPDSPDAMPFFLPKPTLLTTTGPSPSSRTAINKSEPPQNLPSARFEDATQRSRIDFQYNHGSTGQMYLADTMGGGVALLDYDADGWPDVYFTNGCPLPFDPKTTPGDNRLYRNQRDGTFRDVTKQAGVHGMGYAMGCAVADYDADGHDDLLVTGVGRLILYHNRRDATFEDVTAKAGLVSDRWSTAAGFADLDADGDLDLVVVTYVDEDLSEPRGCRDHSGRPIHCSPKVYPAQPDHLFRNNADGTFTDVSNEAGFDGPEGRGLGLAIADLDDDGKLDIFVANDASANFYFHNLGGMRFEELGLSAGLALDGTGRATASMGVVADDLDGDSLIDIFHTNFLNEPNTLHKNLGGGQFQDSTLAAGLDGPSHAKTGFGAAALDANNDGYLDLFVANGHVDDQPWVQSPMAQHSQLFLGTPSSRFTLAPPAATSEYLARSVVGRGLAAGDLDRDGRVDVIVVHRDQPATVLRNVTPGGHALGIRLRASNLVGTRVTCHSNGTSQTRWLTCGTSYLSVNDPTLWFGLGKNTRVDRLDVRWPSGLEKSYLDRSADQILDIAENEEPRSIALYPGNASQDPPKNR